MRLISEDVRSIRGALLFAYVTIEKEPFQAPPEPGASCQAGSCRRVDRRLSIPNGRREIARGIINTCCIAVKLRASHCIALGDARTLEQLSCGATTSHCPSPRAISRLQRHG